MGSVTMRGQCQRNRGIVVLLMGAVSLLGEFDLGLPILFGLLLDYKLNI